MELYYQGITDEAPAKITVIQYAQKGKRAEIIRDTQIEGREKFSGFWVDTDELLTEVDIPSLKYRDKGYFNEDDLYVFDGTFRLFESKVHYDRGRWWTNESLNYKCSSIKCVKIK